MPIFKGSKLICTIKGSRNIGKVYHASTLMFQILPINTVLFSTRNSGTYSFTIPTLQNYRITVVGGGGGGATSSGGSSGLFIGDIKLNKGTVLSIVIGAGSAGGNRNAWAQNGGSSSVSGLVSIPGGGGGDSQRNGGIGHGAGGVAATVQGAFYRIIKNSTGNNGDGWIAGGHGGYSLVDGTLTGPGAGGDGTNQSTTFPGATGQSGWVEIRTI